MAAAAYAALVSLMNTMDQIQIHPILSTSFNKYQNQSLRQKLDFLVDFVENYSGAEATEAEDLMRQIAVAAREAEDIIEVHAAYRIRSRSSTNTVIMPQKLQSIIKVMDSIRDQAIVVKEGTGSIMPRPSPFQSARTLATTKTNMVGFDSYVRQLLDKLTGHPSHRQILPIIGMGGIGKTELARNVYENVIMVGHFDVRAWMTISQEFSASEIISQALTCLGRPSANTDKTYDQLGEELHKILYGRRYLMVLDDMWTVEAWEKIKFFLPDNDNGSRIIVTTRQSELVDYFGSSALAVDFLDYKNSWDLFCEKTFSQKSCPPELKQSAKKIVRKCKGLPLAIVVIAGLLGKSPKTQEYWEEIAKDRSSIPYSEEGNINPLSILHLSYKHLPVCLKSCFLHLGLFPEDHSIDVSQLIKLWVAEGFIKPKTDQSLEEVSESYIKDLVDRNLLIVGKLRENKRFEICHVHDLVRDLCIEIAEKENFFSIQRRVNGTRGYIIDERTARLYTHIHERPSLIRPLKVCWQRDEPVKSRLLRVLVNHKGERGYAFTQVNLRFLHHFRAGMSKYKVPSSISLMWSLQTLIFDVPYKVYAPPEIWNMQQLRHVEMTELLLPNPPTGDEVLILENLQTLKTVKYLVWSEEVCRRTPNIKDLRLSFKRANPSYHLSNIGCLKKLETLAYYGRKSKCAPYSSLQNLKLPSSLKELILVDSKFAWSDMTIIGALPHLEILKLCVDAAEGAEWNVGDEEFFRLKVLHMNMCHDLIYWNVRNSNFQVLEELVLGDLPQLKEIPWVLAEVTTLELLHIFDCTESAIVSAVRIQEEQENLGNEGLRLELVVMDESEEKMWRKKIRKLGIDSPNLHIIRSKIYND